MAYVQIPQFGLAIDWETSGYSLPNYAEKHQGISFGAIIYDTKSYAEIEHLYCEIRFDAKYEWSDGAEKIHGLTREYLAHKITQEEAAVTLANMVVKYCGTDDVQVLGHRVHFDKCFTDQLMSTIGIKLSWHPTVIDSATLGTALLETSKSDDLFTLLGLPMRGEHNSLEDIRYTLQSVKKMKEYCMLGITQSMA